MQDWAKMGGGGRLASRERRRGLHKGTEVLSSAQNALSLSQFIEITNMLVLSKMSLKHWSVRSWFSVEKTQAVCGGWCVPMKSVGESESLVDLLWILMLLLCPLCFSFYTTEAVMLPFFSKVPWGWYLAAEFPRVALSAGSWQCPCSCTARGHHAPCRAQFTQGKDWSQANSKYLLQDFFLQASKETSLLLFWSVLFSAPLQSMPTCTLAPLGTHLQPEPFLEELCRDTCHRMSSLYLTLIWQGRVSL